MVCLGIQRDLVQLLEDLWNGSICVESAHQLLFLPIQPRLRWSVAADGIQVTGFVFLIFLVFSFLSLGTIYLIIYLLYYIYF